MVTKLTSGEDLDPDEPLVSVTPVSKLYLFVYKYTLFQFNLCPLHECFPLRWAHTRVTVTCHGAERPGAVCVFQTEGCDRTQAAPLVPTLSAAAFMPGVDTAQPAKLKSFTI